MNFAGRSNIQSTAKMVLLVKHHLSSSINTKTDRQKADPEGISEIKTLARERCCNYMADATTATEQPQCTTSLALSPAGLSLLLCLAHTLQSQSHKLVFRRIIGVKAIPSSIVAGAQITINKLNFLSPFNILLLLSSVV